MTTEHFSPLWGVKAFSQNGGAGSTATSSDLRPCTSQVLRNQGKFNAKLPLGRYPFDTQHLVVEFEHTSADSTRVVYVSDDDPISLSENLTIPGWNIGDPSLEVIENTYPTDFDPTDFGYPETETPSYSRVIVDVPVTRPHGTYALKLLLPMLLVALTAALSLSVHPRYVEGRITVGITTCCCSTSSTSCPTGSSSRRWR